MRKFTALVASAFAVAALAFAPAALAGPHYVTGPTATVSGNSLTVSWKAAGLGNTVTSADFSLTGTANVTSQCFTKSGNPVNGVPEERDDRSQRDWDVPGAERAGDGQDGGRADIHARVHRQPTRFDPVRHV
jgi:hypothetical protein